MSGARSAGRDALAAGEQRRVKRGERPDSVGDIMGVADPDEPGWVRVVRSFVDEHEDVDAALAMRSMTLDADGCSTVLIWRGRVFAALRPGVRGSTVLVPEALQDPDDRGVREVVWQEATDRSLAVRMDNHRLSRLSALSLEPRPPEPRTDTNSRRTRVQPVMSWLRDHGDYDWPARLLALADRPPGVDPGAPLRVSLDVEHRVSARPERLLWMLENGSRLVPSDGRRLGELEHRLARMGDLDAVRRAVELHGARGLPRVLLLEGSTSADCLVECERLVLWIEGKRRDWLAPSCTWDINRDQLARNLEAAWSLATASDRDFFMLVCFENELRRHEQLLIDGYRSGTWSGGWPHLGQEVRGLLASRIGLTRWRAIAQHWPALFSLPELADLPPDASRASN
jgi:hypothetical protein